MSNLESAVCPWCEKMYPLGDARLWPKHTRRIGLGEDRRPGQTRKRCEGSGAYCMTDVEQTEFERTGHPPDRPFNGA